MTHRIYSLLAASILLLIIFASLIWLADADFFKSTSAFFKGAFGGRKYAYLLVTISRAALITGMAIAALIAFRAGLFNIGGEGQLVIGGLASAFVAINLPFGGPAGIFLVLLAGMIAAGVWAMLAGIMKLWLGVPILVGTLLLNYPARYIASYFVSHPLRDIASGMPQTHLIEKSLWLPLLPGTRLDIGFIFILFVFCIVLIYCYRTVGGYEAKMTGLSIDFANASGLKTKKISLKTLALLATNSSLATM